MKKNLAWIIVGAVVLVALVAAFAPGLLSWLLPGISAAGLAGAAAVNKEKRKEERAATEADKKEVARTNEEIANKKETLAATQTEQQQLFVTHDKDREQLNNEYKEMVEEEIAASKNMTAQEKLDYLKSRRSSRT